MKRIAIGLVAVSMMITGCVSPLRSSNSETRKRAIEEISDQKELFFIAMNIGVGIKGRWPELYKTTHLRDGEYPEDVRVMAVNKITNTDYLLCCATWQDGDFYFDRDAEQGRFVYKGETYYLHGYESDGKRDMTHKTSAGDSVRAAATARLKLSAVGKSLAGDVRKNLLPVTGRDSNMNHETSFIDYYGGVKPNNPLDVVLCEVVAKESSVSEISSFLYDASIGGTYLAPNAYEGALRKLNGVDSATAKAIFRKLFLGIGDVQVGDKDANKRKMAQMSHNSKGEAIRNAPKEWPWLVYQYIENPEIDIVKAALQYSDITATDKILAKVTAPDVFVAIYGDKTIVESVPEDKRVTLSGSYGSKTVDLVHDEAVAKLKLLSNQKALTALAEGSELFSIRVAAIEKIEDESVLAKIASGEIKDCPYDTSLKGYSWNDNGISWMSKMEDLSKESLQKCAIERMKNAESLKTIRRTVSNAEVKKAVTKRLASLGFSDVDEICAYDHYDADLFAMLETMGDEAGLNKVASNAKLKGVRVMAAQKISPEMFATIAKKESVTTTQCEKGKINLGGYFLGLSIEDAYAMLAASYPLLNPKLYLDGKVLCIADAKGNDIAWANAQSKSMHWLTLPPQVVKSIVGFESGSFDDLECAVERKFAVSFGTDIVKKGEVSQQIGNLDTTEGETLRYFKSDLGKGEDFSRSVRKAVNQHTMDNHPLNGGVGAAFANAFENAQQQEENAKNAKSPRFAARGSLQLQATSQATKGEWGATGKIGAAAVSIIKTLEDSVDSNN